MRELEEGRRNRYNGSVISISTSYRFISFTNSVEGGRATSEENM